MAVERIGEMTVEELRDFIRVEVDQRMSELWKRTDRRTLKEVLASIDRNRWTPPPDAPSNLELLREDRDA